MMRAVVTVAFVIVCSSTIGVVRAAEGNPPCLADAQRLCPMIPDIGGFVQGCLENHWEGLSAECRKHVGTTASGDQKVRDACGSDTDRFCDDASPAAGEQIACLVKHRETLSSRCRDALDDESAKSAPEPPADALEAAGVADPFVWAAP